MKTLETWEMSMASRVTKVPLDLKPGGKTDYHKTKIMYKKFWIGCQECFVFWMDIKHAISIDQMERTPKDWTIQKYEEQGMLRTKHYLVNMPDPSIKQTLCVMPNTNVRFTTWNEISKRKFYIINGQHNVAANKDMQMLGLLGKYHEVLQGIELLHSLEHYFR
jgi:hypothetical protein